LTKLKGISDIKRGNEKLNNTQHTSACRDVDVGLNTLKF